MPIIFRTAGDWGPGQGTNLSAAQVDENFYEIATRLEELETNPPTPISIHHFTVEGSLFTIVLTDGSEHGPFVLPIGQWRWTGPWQPVTQYFVGDILQDTEGNTFFVRVQHISAATFDPDLFTVDGQVYILLISKAAQPYDIGMFYNDLIESGERLLMLHVSVRDFTIPINFEGSQAFLNTPATDTPIILPIYKDDGGGAVVVGQITFIPGLDISGTGQFGTFSSVDEENPIEMEAGDRLSISQPYDGDSTAAGLSVTIVTETPSL